MKIHISSSLRVSLRFSMYNLQLHNRFQVLQELGASSDFEDHWIGFKEAVTEAAEEAIGRRRGTQREKWMQERT